MMCVASSNWCPTIQNCISMHTWTIWRFLHAHAGLLVDGSMIAEFACRKGSIEKTLRVSRGTLACTFHMVMSCASPSDLDLRLLTFRSLDLTPVTPAILVQKEPRERQSRFEFGKPVECLAMATIKTEDDNPLGLAFGAFPIWRGIRFSLYEHVCVSSEFFLTIVHCGKFALVSASFE